MAKVFNLPKPESTREAQVKRAVKKFGGTYIKLAYTTNGLPDRLALLPGHRSWFLEIKRDGYKPSRLQDSRLKKLRSMGFNTKVINSEKAYLDLIIEFELL